MALNVNDPDYQRTNENGYGFEISRKRKIMTYASIRTKRQTLFYMYVVFLFHIEFFSNLNCQVSGNGLNSGFRETTSTPYNVY